MSPYLKGSLSYSLGVTLDQNPYPSRGRYKNIHSLRESARYRWYMGWLDAWRVNKHGANSMRDLLQYRRELQLLSV